MLPATEVAFDNRINEPVQAELAGTAQALWYAELGPQDYFPGIHGLPGFWRRMTTATIPTATIPTAHYGKLTERPRKIQAMDCRA